MKYSDRFFLYAPLCVFLTLCVGVSINWWIEACALAERLSAANGREVVPGVTLSFAAKNISGFPFRLDTEFRDLSLTWRTGRGWMRWTTAKFAAHALTYGRNETVFEAAGRQVIQWSHQTPHIMPFEVGSLHASAIMQAGGLGRFDLELVGLGSPSFTAQRVQLHVRRAPDNTLEALVTADDARADRPCPANLRIAATLTRADVLVPLLRGWQDWDSALMTWHRAGGRASAGYGFERLPDLTALADSVCG